MSANYGLMCESGDTGHIAFLEIERSKVPLSSKLCRCLFRWVPRLNMVQVVCGYVIVLSVVSFTMVTYLKLLGETESFCLYDSWSYLVYYIFMSLFMAVVAPLSDFDILKPERVFWRWARRLTAYSLFIEIQAIIHLTVFYQKIMYEIEYDDEAQALVWGLSSVGLMRLGTLLVGYCYANKFLERVAQRKKLANHYYGNTFNDVADILVAELVILSLYHYPMSIYNISFVLSVSYLYVFYARF